MEFKWTEVIYMYKPPDNPIIRNFEMFGYPDIKHKSIFCPVCGAENPEELYMKSCGFQEKDIVGCSDCIRTVDAWDYYVNRSD